MKISKHAADNTYKIFTYAGILLIIASFFVALVSSVRDY